MERESGVEECFGKLIRQVLDGRDSLCRTSCGQKTADTEESPAALPSWLTLCKLQISQHVKNDDKHFEKSLQDNYHHKSQQLCFRDSGVYWSLSVVYFKTIKITPDLEIWDVLLFDLKHAHATGNENNGTSHTARYYYNRAGGSLNSRGNRCD